MVSYEKKPNSLIYAGLPEGNASVRWTGEVEPEVTGDYLFQTFSNSGIKMWVDNQLVINHWRQGWLPRKEVARVRLEAGHRHKIQLVRADGKQIMVDGIKALNKPELNLEIYPGDRVVVHKRLW